MRTLATGVMLALMAQATVVAQPADHTVRSRPSLTIRRAHAAILGRLSRPRAEPVTLALDPAGFVQVQTPFTLVETQRGPTLVRIPHYLGPDGSYDSPADLTRDINGIPCGRDCTERSLERWGYSP